MADTPTPKPNPEFDNTKEAISSTVSDANAKKQAIQDAINRDLKEIDVVSLDVKIHQRFEALSQGISLEKLNGEAQQILEELETKYAPQIEAAKAKVSSAAASSAHPTTTPPSAPGVAPAAETATTEGEEVLGSLKERVEKWRGTLAEKMNAFFEGKPEWVQELGKTFTASAILQAIFKYVAESNIPVLSEKAKELLLVEELHQIQNETGDIIKSLGYTLGDADTLKTDEKNAKNLWSAWNNWREKKGKDDVKENKNGSYRDFLKHITDGKTEKNITVANLVEWAGVKDAETAATDFDAEIKKSKEAAAKAVDAFVDNNSLAEIVAFAKDPNNKKLRGGGDFSEISADGFFNHALEEKEKASKTLTPEQKEALKTQLHPEIKKALENFAETVIVKEVVYKKLGLDPEEDQVQVEVVSVDKIKLTNVGLKKTYTLEKQESGKWKVDSFDCNDEQLREKIGELNVIKSEDIAEGSREALVEKLGLEKWKNNIQIESNVLKVFESTAQTPNTKRIEISASNNKGEILVKFIKLADTSEESKDIKFSKVAEYIKSKFNP